MPRAHRSCHTDRPASDGVPIAGGESASESGTDSTLGGDASGVRGLVGPIDGVVCSKELLVQRPSSRAPTAVAVSGGGGAVRRHLQLGSIGNTLSATISELFGTLRLRLSIDSRYAHSASRAFSFASSRLRPHVKHPGRSGKLTLYASSARSYAMTGRVRDHRIPASRRAVPPRRRSRPRTPPMRPARANTAA